MQMLNLHGRKITGSKPSMFLLAGHGIELKLFLRELKRGNHYLESINKLSMSKVMKSVGS